MSTTDIDIDVNIIPSCAVVAEAPIAQTTRPLYGLRVFVVEDEALLMMLLENMLDELGCVVAGHARTVRHAQDALDRLASAADVAILDVNLGGERIFPVADALAERGIPFLFTTGYGPSDLDGRYPGRTIITKPYVEATLVAALLDARRAMMC